MMATRRRVVVTGVGVVTPVGTGREAFWAGVTSGRSVIGPITRFCTNGYRSTVAGEIRDFEPARYIEDAKRLKRLDRFSQLALAGARLALEDAALEPRRIPPERVGACVGSALGGVAFGEGEHIAFQERGLRAVNPMLALSMFPGAGSCNIAIEYGFTGPNTANSDSCSSGAIAIGNAAEFIRRGQAEVMLAGGVEAPLAPLTFGAFDNIRAMSTAGDDPSRACRPFDRTREGFVMAEGAGNLVLESAEHAAARGATPLAELLGWGLTNDGFHMTAPRPDGSSAARAMRLALADAGVAPEEIDAVSAHGSGTPLNDRTETAAIKQALGERAWQVPVFSTKSMHGHALGATGAWEAVACCLALREQFVPPTANLREPDPECDLDYVPNTGRDVPLRRILSNSFGFGGINAALVFGLPA
jgi:3-oxoacyl-[acyl-carrier-protein] synthase II